jgi:osmotically-inducible protein OsmY
MADRDRYEWDRGREYGDRDREYGRGNDRERGYQDRGAVSRGADEVRSWFGDDDAQRRREMDEQRDRQPDRESGANSERTRREHGWTSSGQSSDSSGRPSRGAAYGDQRDFVTRGNDWSGSQYSPRGREWDDPNYGRGGGQWQGGSRDYGDEDRNRRYDAGSVRTQNAGPFGASGGYGAQQSFGPRTSGWDNYGSSGTSRYGADAGMRGEGRWSGQGSSTNYSAGGGFSGAGSSNDPGASHAGRGPRSYQRSDDRIREDVNERLTADPRIDASDIDVRVQNGEVILSGTVDERRTRRLAEEIIEDLPGVRDVRNDLKVNSGSWFGGSKDRDEHDRNRQTGEQARGQEDGALGHTGDPQKRDDVTTLNTKEPGKR